jgi:DNA-binding transcriptional LysR family regulator
MELRHLKYFVAVVEWKGFREASRRLHVAQPAISQTLTNLETEIGVKLFEKSGRSVQLTREGEIFYSETLRTLEQSERAVDAVQRAARGEVGTLSVAFCGADTHSFMPDLVRKYKEKFPGVRVNLLEMNSVQQEAAFAERTIDVGFTRSLSPNLSATVQSRLLSRDPLVAVLPACRRLKDKRVKVEDLAKERFILYHRKGAPPLFDSILGLCNERGFSPNVENQPDMLQTVLTLVAADQGVAIVPSCAFTLGISGVQFLRLRPDSIRTELVIAWPKIARSAPLSSFVDLVEASIPDIQRKTKLPN